MADAEQKPWIGAAVGLTASLAPIHGYDK